MKRKPNPHRAHAHAHDRSYRALFSHPETVADLLRGFVHEPWVDDLDIDRLERLPADYLSGLTERRGDVVWRLPWRQRPLYLLILLEIQSTDDRLMALRLLVYAGLLLSELARRGELAPGGQLPPVLPLVVYNGARRWSAPRDLSSLFPALPPELARHQPQLSYLLLDERHTPVDPEDGNLVTALAALEQSDGPDDLRRIIALLSRRWDRPEHASLRRTILAWLRHVLVPAKIEGGELPEVEHLSEVSNMLQEKVASWVEDWKAEGLREGRREGQQLGRREGEAELLKHQIGIKFGPLTPAVARRIDRADSDTIRRWSVDLLSADALADVFRSDG